MSRERVEFKRPEFRRKIHRLFVIATEGEKTEKKYFESLLSNGMIRREKIYLWVLHNDGKGSSPQAVLARLDVFKSEYKITGEDELWMVIDRDKQSWSPKQISHITSLCSQKKYNYAISNPCFELWILLHFKDIASTSDAYKNEIKQNKKVGRKRRRIETEIIKEIGSYNKSNPNCDLFLDKTNNAITNSKKLYLLQRIKWTEEIGTHLHFLVEKLTN